MDRMLRYFLRQFIRRGTITFTTAGGEKFTCGDGTGPHIFARFLTAEAELRILLNPELALGEIYMDGNFVVENGSIADALAILMDQPDVLPGWAKPQWLLRYLARHLRQFNPRGRARNNVAHHYDLDGRLYSLFLDSDKQYSCAYFEIRMWHWTMRSSPRNVTSPPSSLIRPRDRILDIGSGWGGLGLYLAETTGADVTGVTLSTEQLQISNARAAEKKLAQSAKFVLSRTTGTFRAHSTASYPSACSNMPVSISTTPISKHCAELLTEDGVMLLHSIGRSDGPDVTNPWITKYIFPGGYIPALSEVLPLDRARRITGMRRRNPAAALCGNAQSLARTLHGAPGGSGPTLR